MRSEIEVSVSKIHTCQKFSLLQPHHHGAPMTQGRTENWLGHTTGPSPVSQSMVTRPVAGLMTERNGIQKCGTVSFLTGKDKFLV
jgi:hypothetical protein